MVTSGKASKNVTPEFTPAIEAHANAYGVSVVKVHRAFDTRTNGPAFIYAAAGGTTVRRGEVLDMIAAITGGTVYYSASMLAVPSL